MNASVKLFVALALSAWAVFTLENSRADAPAKNPQTKQWRVLRLGGVAYSPDSVTVWRGIRHYLSQNGMPIDFVLYSNYDALIKALHEGQIDIAWNSPLAHGKFHLLAGGQSQTLAMRDVDCNYRCQMIARKGAGISGLPDLAGNTMVFGSCDSAEATVLPVYFLKKAGVSFKNIKIVSLHKDVDKLGCPCNSEHFVLKALKEGRGSAGIISEELWKRLTPAERAQFKVIWKSPAFSHCVFTARKDFDKNVGARFTKLMLAMDGKDPITAEVLRLEQASRWVAGSQEGYAPLLEALRDADAVSLGR